ncbi:MAG: Rrf2 family transcriptional regulator [Terricaulis sp.]
MLTNKAKYALRAMIDLAVHSGGENQTRMISEIAKDQHIPRRFLENILLEMRNEGFVVSYRGKTGGYALARDADEISFADIIRVIDGPLALTPCASRTAYQKCDDCKDEMVCVLRNTLVEARDAVADVLENTTIAQAAANARRKRKSRSAA